MKEIKLKINEESTGMHARPASRFVKISSKYKSDIFLIKDEIEVNGKSILGLLMLSLTAGEEFILKIDGPDEEIALEKLQELVKNNFGE